MPTTALGALSVPTTGTESGTWGSASLNPNFIAIDGSARGVVTLSLSTAASITLTAPSGTITPGAGPTQAQNAVIKLSGTLSGSPGITFPLPGYYIVENNCTVGSNVVALIPGNGAGGGYIYAPPGETSHIYTDGTNIKYVNLGRVGSYLDLAVATTPLWISGQTTPPYLLCDGTTYSTSVYSALGALLGSTFGGNGATTFGVPDLRNRYRIPVSSVGRVTTAGSGVDGATLGASGGQQGTTILQTHLPNYPLTVIDPTHNHGTVVSSGFVGTVTPGGPPNYMSASGGTTAAAATGISVALGGGGNTLPTVPPALVAGITLIKT